MDAPFGDIGNGVSATALTVAAGRAIETSRREGLISDPYAGRFVSAFDSAIPTDVNGVEDLGSELDKKWWYTTAIFMGVRSRHFDNFLVDAWKDGVRQTVILGAGLDSRGFRLNCPASNIIFEVDQPEILEFKERVLRDSGVRSRCIRHVISADVCGPWSSELVDKGFDENQPTAWLAEGLLPYLPPNRENDLLMEIRDLSAGGSQVGFDFVVNIDELLSVISPLASRTGLNLSPLFPSGAREDPIAVLRDCGWNMTIAKWLDLMGKYTTRPIRGPKSASYYRYVIAWTN